MKITKKLLSGISCLLTMILIFSAVSPAFTVSAEEAPAAEQTEYEDYAVPERDSGDEIQSPESHVPPVYEDGVILIYNYEQLRLIGSGAELTDSDYMAGHVGEGAGLLSGSGEPVSYGSDCRYRIARDIALPRHSLWSLPAGFSGKITGERTDDPVLYDEDSDTVYLCNPCQLALMSADDAAIQPVMTGDASTSTFGTGQVIPVGDGYLTYSDSHRYVISPRFDNDMTERSAAVRVKGELAATGAVSQQVAGRDFAGQVIKKINGETYILIGNEAQLRAIGTDLQTTLSNLLNARANDPTIFATGSFAGRVYGDVIIEDCCVSGTVSVSNVNDRTGGFIGYSEGMTEYSGLSQILGGTVDVLAAILNAVPAVGLGDLITILLGNALPLEDLIPTNYIAPVIRGCEVNGLKGYLGRSDRDFAGGFIGQQIGTRIENSSVTDSAFTVRANDYGGGFTGLMRDANIKGTLDGVGIDLSSILQNIHPQSALIGCDITDCNYQVTGTDCIGGFIGAMNSSYAVDCTIDCVDYPLSIDGSGDYTGGFAGYASVGWQSTFGKDENQENSLLGTVRQLVTGLLSTDKSTGQKLLSLMGVSPSAILGCQVDSGELTVSAGESFAGGYCGHNEGGHIWGLNTNTWKDQNDGIVAGHDYGHNTEGAYTGEQHICTAWRIRSVYGYEYAGGFTGYMESADTADTGNIKLLGGLISANNALSALSMVYPTEESTAVYGPLRNMDAATWNLWVQYIGRNGGFGSELARSGTVSSQAQLDSMLSDYIYGCNVVAGRSSHDNMLITEGGNAGGYVGYMVTGVITNGQSYDMKKIRAMRSAGGYAGRMQTGAAAEFGSVDLLGLNLNIGQLVSAVQTFVPTVKSGSAHGWQSGMTVTAFGTDFTHKCGYAGGYVGSAYGAQIWGDKNVGDTAGTGCNVSNLRFVRGTNAADGYAGLATAASVADVSTKASDGFLQRLLDTLISTPGDLASVLQATVTTVRQARIDPDSDDFGFAVEGLSGTPPRMAGGFAGSLEASVIGSRKGESRITVNGLRRVDGLNYAGGFVGLADVGSVASVSSTGTGSTSILSLIQAGSVDLLDVFRTYIYYSDVNGVDEGFSVHAYSADNEGLLSEIRYTGCAGGFAGGVMNGSVKHSNVARLNTVTGVNYTGGFVGHAVLSGHRGLPTAELFTDLDQLEVGDEFYIKTLDKTLCYTVDQILTILPDRTEELAIQEGKDYVTLVTCTPYGVNSHRLLVRGVRTPFDEAQDIPVYNNADMGSFWSRLPAQYRHMLYGAAAILVFLIVYWMIIMIRKNSKKRRVPEDGEVHENGEKTE